MDNHMRDVAMAYAQEVKRSGVYREYAKQLEEISAQPELYGKVNELRKKTFDIQNSGSSDDIMDRMEDLEREYAWLRENTLVEDFLQAELGFCRMMQDLEALIIRELNFQ